MNSKERAKLRSIAMVSDDIGQIGKNGLTENMIIGFKGAIETREVIKINVLKSQDEDVRYLADKLANQIGAEVVCTIGRKIILYKYSDKPGIKHVLESK